MITCPVSQAPRRLDGKQTNKAYTNNQSNKRTIYKSNTYNVDRRRQIQTTSATGYLSYSSLWRISCVAIEVN